MKLTLRRRETRRWEKLLRDAATRRRADLLCAVFFEKQVSVRHHKSPNIIIVGAHLISRRLSGVVVQASLCRPQEDIKGRIHTDWSPETYLPECHLRLMYSKQRCYLLVDNGVLQA